MLRGHLLTHKKKKKDRSLSKTDMRHGNAKHKSVGAQFNLGTKQRSNASSIGILQARKEVES